MRQPVCLIQASRRAGPEFVTQDFSANDDKVNAIAADALAAFMRQDLIPISDRPIKSCVKKVSASAAREPDHTNRDEIGPEYLE